MFRHNARPVCEWHIQQPRWFDVKSVPRVEGCPTQHCKLLQHLDMAEINFISNIARKSIDRLSLEIFIGERRTQVHSIRRYVAPASPCAFLRESPYPCQSHSQTACAMFPIACFSCWVHLPCTQATYDWSGFGSAMQDLYGIVSGCVWARLGNSKVPLFVTLFVVAMDKAAKLFRP